MQRLTVIAFAVLASCAAPRSDVTISSLDYGTLTATGTYAGELRVTNTGASVARLERIVRREGSDAVLVTTPRVRLEPGESTVWRVSFKAQSPGLAQTRFDAVFDTGATSFTVRGRLVVEPCEPFTLDLGDTRVGRPLSRTVELTNAFAERTSVSVASPGAPFSVEPSGKLELAPHETKVLTVTFHADTVGEASAPWRFATRTDCVAASNTLQARAVAEPLEVVPSRLHFGELAAGTEGVRSVELVNHTRTPLGVTSAVFDSEAFTLLTSLPLQVPAQGRATLDLRAQPASTAAVLARLVLTTDVGELALPLHVNRAARCLRLAERADFPAVEAGCRSTGATLTLQNECTHEVALSTPRVSPGFALVSSSARSLSPGATERLNLLFAPVSSGALSGTFELEADGIERVQVALSGTGLAPTVVEETSVVPDDLVRLDVLLVIDDSPRMAPLAASVAQNMFSFGRYLEANNYRTRVAVMSTSTDPSRLGQLRRTPSGQPFLENPAPSEVQALTAVTGQAPGRSSCVEALHAAFSSPSPELTGFLRPNTPLYVVCVTNGRDELEAPAMTTIASLISRLPRHWALAVVARFSETASCPGTVDHGTLTAFAQSSFSDIREEICTPNWVIALERIGRTSFGYRVDVPVAGSPALDRGPMQVFFNDLELPPETWTWESVRRAVVFEPLYAPAPLTRVRVRYTTDCPQ